MQELKDSVPDVTSIQGAKILFSVFTFALRAKKLSLRAMKTLFIILGSISLALGIIGIFVPLLPTTPFLLLTAALYFKSSPRLYNWLLKQKHLGPYIRNFRENKAIPLRGKILCMVFMWGTMLYCIFFLIPYLWVKIILFLIAVGVSWHVLSYKTLKKER